MGREKFGNYRSIRNDSCYREANDTSTVFDFKSMIYAGSGQNVEEKYNKGVFEGRIFQIPKCSANRQRVK